MKWHGYRKYGVEVSGGVSDRRNGRTVNVSVQSILAMIRSTLYRLAEVLLRGNTRLRSAFARLVSGGFCSISGAL